MDQSNVQFNEEIERYLNGLNINRDEFTSQEKFVLKKIMQEFERTGKSNILNSLYMQDYDEIPVPIERYLTDPEYAGNTTDQGRGIWPFWRGVLSKIFSPQFQYMKVIFGGSIGTGKSSIACIGISYVIYKLLCLKDPAEYYEVMKGSKPGIALFNITLDKGFGVAFHKINSICKNSPWFLRNGDLSGSRTNEVYLPGKGVTIGVGSMADHFIGLDIFACMMDEMSFKDNKELDMTKMKAYDALQTIDRRMVSRFMSKGTVPGMSFLVSSARTEDDFLSQYMETRRNDPRTLIIQKPLYEVVPKSRYRGETFPVAIGIKSADQYVITEEEVESFKSRGYQIYNVPVEHRAEFDPKTGDLQGAIRDILGLSLKTAGRFLDSDRVDSAINEDIKNIFSTTEIPIGFSDNSSFLDYLVIGNINTRLIKYPIFVHHDLSLGGDGTGIFASAVCVDPNLTNGVAADETDTWRFIPVFWMKLRPRYKGEQIPYYKIRRDIIKLRDEYGFNILGVTADGYQSADMLQQYSLNGFWTMLLSMDRAPSTPYHFARTCLYDGRSKIPNDEILITELKQLVENRRAQKIDHPSGGCFTADTAILLADGSCLSFNQLLSKKCESIFGVSYQDGNYISLLYNFRCTKEVRDLVVVVFNDGSRVKCTPEHLFLLNDGVTYVRAECLNPGDICKSVNSKNGLGVDHIERCYYKINIPVYDLSSSVNDNFALFNGVVVHNSKDLSDAYGGSLFGALEYNKKNNGGLFKDRVYLFSELIETNKTGKNIHNNDGAVNAKDPIKHVTSLLFDDFDTQNDDGFYEDTLDW